MTPLSRISSEFLHTGTLSTVRHTVEAGRWTVVDDTLTNRSTNYLGVLVRHSVRSVANGRCCGRAGPQWGDPANPTLYSDGIGLIALDDAFRIHVNCFLQDGTGSLCDLSRVLPPGATQIMRWACTAADTYEEFASACRALLSPPVPVPGPPAWLRLNHGWDDAAIVRHAELTGCAYLVLTDPAKDPHGLDLARQDFAAIGNEIDRRRRLLPHVEHLLYFDFGFIGSGPPQLDYAGKALCYPGTNWPLCVPSGSYAEQMRDIARHLASLADGLFIDLFECGDASHPYHYGQPWDGCSGDVDVSNGRLLGLKSSVALLTHDFRLSLVRDLQAQGKAVVGNMAPWTQTSADLRLPRLVECKRDSDYASLDVCATPLAYLAASAHSQDDADALAQVAVAHHCLPVDPWDVDFVRTRETVGKTIWPPL